MESGLCEDMSDLGNGYLIINNKIEKSMKTKLLLFALCVSGMSYAQTGEKVGYSEKAGMKTEFKTNKFWDNWYLSLGGGISSFYGTTTGSFSDQIKETNPVGKLTVGKWINPMFGLRLQGMYGKVTDTYHTSSSAFDFDYAGGHVDAMLNLMNTFENTMRRGSSLLFRLWVLDMLVHSTLIVTELKML